LTRVNRQHQLYFVGSAADFDDLTRRMRVLPYVLVLPVESLTSWPKDIHFLVAKFGDVSRIARAFSAADSTQTVKYLLDGEIPKLERMLFANEIGATLLGPDWQRDLKKQVRKQCEAVAASGGLQELSAMIETAVASHDIVAAQDLIESLKSLPRGEAVATLLARLYSLVGWRRHEQNAYKEVLRHNPQNLWAANALGRSLIEDGEVYRGIEILERLSRYHTLNSERFLYLGRTYVDAGQGQKAKEALAAAAANGDMSTDVRFQTTMAKVHLLEGDVGQALAQIAGKELSTEFIAFLNIRAILAVRNKRVEEGLQLYQQAERACGERSLVKARVLFNKGLALARSGDLTGAIDSFEQSLKCGGTEFIRASGPLAIVKKVAERDGQVKVVMDEEDWEKFSAA
jgi:tetratricopeptide (TPR) repeat protein